MYNHTTTDTSFKSILLFVFFLMLTNSPLLGQAALDLDGNSDYVDFGDLDAVDGVSQLTVETWVYLNSFPSSEGQVFYKGGEWNADNNISIEVLFNGTIYVFNRNGGNYYGYTASGAITSGQWYHLAYVLDGSQASNTDRLKLYINGVATSLTHAGPIPTTTTSNSLPFVIGGNSTGMNNGSSNRQLLNAKFDDFRIWSTARTASEISSNMNQNIDPATPDLIAYYTLDDGTPNANNAGITTATDMTGNGNNGTLFTFALNGTSSNWVGSAPITNNNFSPPADIPTLSEWGLIILALFLMTLGTLYLLQPNRTSWSKSQME